MKRYTDRAEYVYDRILTILEVCERLGVSVSVDPKEYLVHVVGVRDFAETYPEFAESMIYWKYDLVLMLRALERMC